MKYVIYWAAGFIVSITATSVIAQSDRAFAHIVGSSTIAPFSAAVSDHIVKAAKVKRPRLESTGTGGGFTLFCESPGLDSPDIVNASRRMKKKEFEACRRNGVGAIVEVKIGYDGIVFAHASQDKHIGGTRKDIYLALAKMVPDPTCKRDCGKLVPNPYQTWQQVNPALPDVKISVLGPAASTGTRDALAELVMDAGCQSYPSLASKKEKNEVEYKKACYTVRNDGVYIETRENDDSVAGRLVDKPHSLAIYNYTLLARHAKELSAEPIEAVMPDYESIASVRYPVSRPLYFYVKADRVGRIPGLAQYVSEFTSEKAWGDKGYLISAGLIAMPPLERKLIAADVKALKPMDSGLAQAQTH